MALKLGLRVRRMAKARKINVGLARKSNTGLASKRVERSKG